MEHDLVMETADIKPCPHGYVFNDACPDCKGNLYSNNPYLRLEFTCKHGHEIYCKACYDEYQAWGMKGELPVRKTYFTCPFCIYKEK